MKFSDIYDNKKGKHIISYEVFPPKNDMDFTGLYQTIEDLKDINPDYVSVTYGAGGSNRDKTLEIASTIKNKMGIEVATHLTCVNATIQDTDTMLERFKNEPKFCPQFHLSLQSGCDATLKRMNRHYDTAFYRDLVGRIRAKFENASITTDIMVGFAGESEEEFNESLAFYKEIGFARGHVFAYSRRAGTVAAALKNQVEEAVKTHRARLMGDAAKASEEAFVKTQIGTKAKVLFETYNDGFNEGYSENYLRLYIKDYCGGKVEKVKVLSPFKDGALAEIKE